MLFQQDAGAGTWLTERAKEGSGRRGLHAFEWLRVFSSVTLGECLALPPRYLTTVPFQSSFHHFFIIPFKYSDFIILFVYILLVTQSLVCLILFVNSLLNGSEE